MSKFLLSSDCFLQPRPADDVTKVMKGLQEREKGTLRGSASSERPTCRWEDNIRMDLKEISVTTWGMILFV